MRRRRRVPGATEEDRLALLTRTWLKYGSEPEFEIMPPRPQAVLEASPFHQSTYAEGKIGAVFYRTEAGFYLRFPGLADFEISADGRSVRCFPAPHVDDTTPEHLYLNQVLPMVFSNAGKFVFHASAVELGGGAVAFAAESGRGKSTLAAYFVAKGHRLLTDDALFLEPSGDSFDVFPSHPSIRLFADSGKMLTDRQAAKAPPLHFTSKTRFLAGETFGHCLEPRTLRTIYFLGDGRSPGVEFRRLSVAEVLMELVRNSFILDVEDRATMRLHFDRLTEVAGKNTCYSLDYPRRFDNLDHVYEAMINHLNSERLAA